LIRLLAIDVDGTITINRKTYKVYLPAINALRKVERRGIEVALVSGNSIQVLRGLARYFGFSGGLVGENGCVLWDGKSEEEETLCNEIDREFVYSLASKYNMRPSWQNKCKKFDLAFYPNYDIKDIKINEIQNNLKGVKVLISGYAIHFLPYNADKSLGLGELMRRKKLMREEVIAVGDSDTDIPMFKIARGIALGNSTSKLKEEALLVVNEKSGRGIVKIASLILNNSLKN
jgi:phosphoglycolate phosphatase (TIGR01487 family)